MIRPLHITNWNSKVNAEHVERGNLYFKENICSDEYMKVSPYKVTHFYGLSCYSIHKKHYFNYLISLNRLEMLQ